MGVENKLAKAAKNIHVPGGRDRLRQIEHRLAADAETLASEEALLLQAVDNSKKIRTLISEAKRFKPTDKAANAELGDRLAEDREAIRQHCRENNIQEADMALTAKTSPGLAQLLFNLRTHATELALRNLSLIFFNLRKFTSQETAETLQDLYIAGYMGLYRAAFTWDQKHKLHPATPTEEQLTFSSYALLHINAQMIIEQNRVESPHLSLNASRQYRRLQHAESQLAQILGRKPLTIEVDARTYLQEQGIINPTLDDVHDLLNTINKDYALKKSFNRFRKTAGLLRLSDIDSLDDVVDVAPFLGEADTSYYQTTRDQKPKHAEALIDDDQDFERMWGLRAELVKAMEYLTPRERLVMQMRCGLDGYEPMTLEEVGFKFKVTRERIRQLEERALRKLRHPLRCIPLKGYMYQ